MAGYTKLHSGILDGSIWSEDVYTRVVWIAFLAKADAEGMVRVAPSRMVKIANVPQAKFDKAVEILESPDPESRTSDDDGRRLRKIEGGWLVINYKKYRNELESEERKAYKREWDRKNRPSGHSRAKAAISGENQQSDTQSDNSPTQPDRSDVSRSRSRSKGIDIYTREEIPIFTEKTFVDAGTLVGLSEAEAKVCFDYYKGQDFQFKPGIFIKDAQDACKRFRNNRHNFNRGQKTTSLEDEHRKAVERGDL